MKREWFVQPKIDTLPLFDGEVTITVKRILNAGDKKKLETGALKRMTPTGMGTDAFQATYDIDFEGGAFNKVMIYLLDWTVVDANGKTVEIDTDKAMSAALRRLHPDHFAEIERVIDLHASLHEKKAKPTSTGSEDT